MESVLLGVLMLAVLYVAIRYGLYLLLRYVFTELAKDHKLVEFRTEGEIKPIMNGNKCDHYLMAVENHIIDPVDFDIIKCSLKTLGKYADLLVEAHNRRKDDKTFVERKLAVDANGQVLQPPRLDPRFEQALVAANTPDWFERIFGVTWVGLPPWHVFKYQFQWIKYGQKKSPDGKPSSEVKMNPREELVYSLYYRYPTYGIFVDDAESGSGKAHKETGLERVQLKLELVMETTTRNPQKTLFRTAGLSSAGDWLGAISKEIRDLVRKWVGETDYDTLISDRATVTEALREIIEWVNNSDPDPEIRKRRCNISAVWDYGQEIVNLSLVNIDLKDPGLQTAVELVFKAEQDVRQAEKERQAAETRAKGARATEAAPFLGRADGYKAIFDAHGAPMEIAKSLGNIKVLSVGGQGQNIISLPESIIEETTSSVPAKSPPGDKSGKKSS